jgi:CheY-like chemotaxis protein
MLLVEDNATDAELAMRAIQRIGLDPLVEVVQDGEAALDFVFSTGPWAGRGADRDPTVVVLDLKLPKVDGVEVLGRIRIDERTRTLPVVMLTSSREDRDVLECFRLGANSYVVKPIDPTDFEQVVSQLAYYWLRLNQPQP